MAVTLAPRGRPGRAGWLGSFQCETYGVGRLAGRGASEASHETPEAETKQAHTSAELMEKLTGTAVDSPLCFTCGTKMRPAGSCYVCEGCGSTSGCS